MDSNTYSTGQSTRPPGGRPARLAALTAAVDTLAGQDLHGVTDAAEAQEVLHLRRLVDRLEGQWLRALAAVDARGAGGADQGTQVASTAS